MIKYKQIENKDQKQNICRNILEALPQWFGIPSAIDDYVKESADMYFYAAFKDETPVGFIVLKENNECTGEIYVMGILKEYHSKGIGKALVKHGEEYLKSKGKKIFHVKTLGPGRADIHYDKTRKFYEKMGFMAVDELYGYWDEANPCLIMVKHLES